MRSNFKDIAGKRIGRWLALSYAGKERWHCRCDCGTERVVTIWGKLVSAACRAYGLRVSGKVAAWHPAKPISFFEVGCAGCRDGRGNPPAAKSSIRTPSRLIE